MEKKHEGNYKTNMFFVAAVAVICTMLWGTAFPAIKIGYEIFRIDSGDIPTKLIFAGARFFLAGIIVIALGLLTEKNKRTMLLKKKDILPVAVLGFFQTFCQYILLYIGIVHITGTKSSILTSVSAFGSVLLSAVFWKSDRLNLQKLLGCMIGIAGIIVMNFDGGGLLGFTLIGDGLVILSNLSGAIGNIVSKKISENRKPAQISGWQLTIGGAALILIGIIFGGKLNFYNTECAAILIYLAAMAGIAFMLWTMLLFYNPVSKVAVFNLLIPVFGTMWSSIFLSENIFTFNNLLSLILVCSGIFLVNSSSLQHKKVIKN
ncbi:MAG: DMT family transporter [Clostridia bacterium]|nr:DMT family transporter [Clostridia bacterium]MBR2176728.1 DMT family transporter [Clostridia bacterium]